MSNVDSRDGYIEWGNRLAEMLEANGISQQTLADEVGLSKSTVSLMIRGKRLPSIQTLQRMVDCIGCSADDLVRGIDFEITDEEGA